ncbi:MAG: hydroxymethylbilane synthase, partial [Thermaurantiacus sp.]
MSPAERGADAAVRIGTRGSPLALVQARLVHEMLGGDGSAALSIIETSGDRVQDRPLREIGGKALWTRELDRALLDGEIDLAVHSMKDV